MVKLNRVKERFIYLSPTVQAGWEDESNIQDFETVKILGRGAFGKVMKCVHKKTKMCYAIKEIDKQNLAENGMKGQMINEVKIMYQLNHPHILKLQNHFEDDKSIYLVLELAPGGQLYQVLWRQPGKRFSEQRVANYIFQVSMALDMCHQNNIIHRDIKPENILLDANNQIKLADFGWSNFKQSSKDVRDTFCGTLDYLAPEMLQKGHEHDFGVDVWSIGVLTYELLTGMSPFAPREKQFNAEYVDQMTKSNIKNLKFNFPSDFPVAAKDLVKKILQKEPKDRLSLKGIMQHQWIANFVKVVPEPQQQQNYQMDRSKQIEKSVDLDNFINSNKDKAIFSNDQIFEFSRPDSIINPKALPSNTASQNLDQSNMSMVSTQSNSSQQSQTSTLLKDQQMQNQKLLSQINQLNFENDKLKKENQMLKQQLQNVGGSNNNNSQFQQGKTDTDYQQKYKKLEAAYNKLKSEADSQWISFNKASQENNKYKKMLQHNENEAIQKLFESDQKNTDLQKQIQILNSQLQKYQQMPPQQMHQQQQQQHPGQSHQMQQQNKPKVQSKPQDIDSFMDSINQSSSITYNKQ